MTVLVTGGAGYIGSHTVRHLLAAGHEVVVLDNFYSGHRWAVAKEASLVEGDIADQQLVGDVIKQYDVTAVVHFAGYIVVPESVENPSKYYENNVVGSLRLIETSTQHGVKHFVFSSSAAVYGIPDTVPVSEQQATQPINPYGHTKLITEMTLNDFAQAPGNDFQFVALRYFNAAGAQIAGGLGQATPEATHLIKVACEAACGKRPNITIFGDDYDTADGTCERDYIHVEDLASAHVDALRYLADGGESVSLNCGYGKGYSVSEVVDAVKRASGIDFTVNRSERRAGDPPTLIADNHEIRTRLGWKPQHDDLDLICKTAYDWERTGLARHLKS